MSASLPRFICLLEFPRVCSSDFDELLGSITSDAAAILNIYERDNLSSGGCLYFNGTDISKSVFIYFLPEKRNDIRNTCKRRRYINVILKNKHGGGLHTF